MSLRKLFFLLILGIIFTITSLLLWQHYQSQKRPNRPCSSIIENGRFIDERFQPYLFNGVITWWPTAQRLTLFGIKGEGENKKTFERTLLLETTIEKNNIIHGKVKDVKVADSDKLPKDQILIGEKGKELSLLFKKIDSTTWLMHINDNWVVMCENK